MIAVKYYREDGFLQSEWATEILIRNDGQVLLFDDKGSIFRTFLLNRILGIFAHKLILLKYDNFPDGKGTKYSV